jgi:hypothetical protein
MKRIFSNLSIIKNKLRYTIDQDRLEKSLILIFTEQELACKLNFNVTIDELKNVIAFKRRLAL